ncbi:MAG TPA: diguanylate cyclase [Syntrophales bacterium]|nr:diguanylate cyclase [Syntrophales bacterium]
MTLQPVSVLVAISNPSDRTGLEKILADAGYRKVVSVANGLKAVAAMAVEFFPIVIIGPQLSGMDGFELCRVLRARSLPGYVYILMLTRGNRKADILKVLEAGADAHLAHPVDPAGLIARLEAARRIIDLERSLRITNEEVRALSIRDPLTGIFNRIYLMERLPQELKRSQRYGHPLAVIMCDIDHFKEVNDQHGHRAGDQILRDFVNRIAGSIRIDVDWMARYGGEEFLIVLPETDLPSSFIVAERLRRLIAEVPFRLKGRDLRITSSFGVTSYQPVRQGEKVSSDLLMEQADEFLYQAKREGRNAVRGANSQESETKGRAS